MSCIITYKGKQYSEQHFKEYFSNNKNEFATAIAKNKDVIDSFKRKMEGIDYVFSQSPELASIGNKAQYLQYLSTIFKTSKVKDIVYHYSPNKFNEFNRQYVGKNTNKDKRELGYYFSDNKNLAELLYGTQTISDVDLETGEPLTVQIKGFGVFAILNNPKKIQEKDDISGYGDYVESNSYIVFEPEQIHILSSKKDLEMFRNFINNKYFKQEDRSNDIVDKENFQLDYENLNLNNQEVLKYLYEMSSKSKDFITFAQNVQELVSALRPYLTVDEILEKLHCL